LGWMGARAEYSCGEGFPLPHELCRRRPARRSSEHDFFNSLETRTTRRGHPQAYCPRGRLASTLVDFSDATVATGGVKDRSAGASFASGALSSVFGDCCVATAVPAAATAASVAAKASASPAPNRSSRPGEPRSRAVLVRIARTSSGFNAGSRSSMRAASPLTYAAENEVPDVI